METVILTVCKDPIDANMIKTHLESEGIACFLTNEMAATLVPHHFMDYKSGVKLYVAVEDLEKARSLLDIPKEETALICPNCKSTNIKSTLGKDKFKMALKVFFSLFAGANTRKYFVYKCKDCKTEFEN